MMSPCNKGRPDCFHELKEPLLLRLARGARLDAIMMLRVQGERMHDAYFPSALEYSRLYGLDSARMARLPEHAVILHPGPMNRGLEIASNVADSDSSAITEQVSNGVAVRMAVLYRLLAQESK